MLFKERIQSGWRGVAILASLLLVVWPGAPSSILAPSSHPLAGFKRKGDMNNSMLVSAFSSRQTHALAQKL